MILSVFEVEVRKADGTPAAVVCVEAVSQTFAQEIAKLIVMDRTHLEAGEMTLDTRVLIQGLADRPPVGWQERSRIKRRAGRWRDGLARMAPDERNAVLSAILREEVPGRPAVTVRLGGEARPPLPLIPIKPRLVKSDEAQEP